MVNHLVAGTIQLLAPGQLGSIVCDMQAPYGDDSLLIEAEVDRGTSIDEVDEENNVKSTLVTIGGAPIDTLQNQMTTKKDSA